MNEWINWMINPQDFDKRGMILFLWKEVLMLQDPFVKGENKPWGSQQLKAMVDA